ncbi:MAG: von Willebrand factor type A domain-containing protein [Candidatus Binatia bacterium]
MSFPPRTRSVAALAALALALLAAGCAGRTETDAPRPAPLASAVAASPSPPAAFPVEANSETLPERSNPEPLARTEGDTEQRPAVSPKSQAAGKVVGNVVGRIAGSPSMARPRGESAAAALADHASRDSGMAGAEIYAFSMPQPSPAPDNTERYQHLSDNPLHLVADDPVSTFSLDVDTGSYSNVRRYLAQGSRPPEDAVRVEELVNYFPYDYPRGDGKHPFGIRTELAPCPWKPDHWLMRVAVRADEVDAKEMPAANLVFLVDVSGSMQDAAKLPLLRSSLKLLVDQLRSQDRVSLVVYAGREAVVLEPTPGDQREAIRRAIDNLEAGGSTAGEAGIRLAYRMARQGYVRGGINRVLLATDGDFNVGITDFEQVKDLVERERESGVQLSTIGFGTGNYNEQLMEQLADVGNGSYAYIDNLQEGRKVLVDQVRSTLVTVAKDVKVQVEFNPSAVAEYRLIGYENRLLAREDFNNDRIDAGDVGAGQSVTALYELTPVGAAPAVDPLRYTGEEKPALVDRALPAELAFVKLRYKDPDGSASKLVEVPVSLASLAPAFEKTGDDFRFAAAVAGFGQLLRGGKRTGSWNWDDVLATATSARGKDEFGYRSEFLSLVRMAKVGG